jgi:CRISPR/Cas system-associated exonuclease Cas4 (RecB family)
LAQNVETCLRNFYASDIYDGLKAHRKEGWLEVEEFSSFQLDNTKIHLVIDCAIKEDDHVLIYDWKTGKSLHDDLSVQLSCYALYAIEKWQIPPDHLRIIEFNLLADKALWLSVTQASLEDIKGYIRGSIKDMQSLLIDVEKNIPMQEDRFSKVEDERVTRRCNFRKVCRPGQ